MRKALTFFGIIFIVLLVSIFDHSRSNAQFGTVSELTEFGICRQGLQRDEVIKRCLIKENPAGPDQPPIEEVVGDWNPFLPNPYYNPPACYNNTSHLNPADDPEKDDPSKPIDFAAQPFKTRHADKTELSPGQEVGPDNELIQVVEGVINPDGQEKPENNEAYLAVFFDDRMAITSLKFALKGGSSPDQRSAEYVMYAGFGRDVNPTPPCVVGSMYNIPLDGRAYEFKVADKSQLPIKADYILIKRLVNANPKTLEISDLSFMGVPAHQGEPIRSTALKGKVFVSGKNNLTLSNSRIYDETDGGDQKKLIATTDNNGSYFTNDLSAFTGKRKILIERDGFKPRRESFRFQQSKTLEKNFPLTFESENSLSGTLTDQSGKPLPNRAVLIYKAGKIVSIARTNAQGKYRVPIEAKGTYQIQPIDNLSLDAPLNLANQIEVKFEQPRGQTQTRNIKANPIAGVASTNTSQLELTLRESIHPLFNGEIIKGAQVKILNSQTKVEKFNGIWENQPILLDEGIYLVTISAAGYEPAGETIVVGEKVSFAGTSGYKLGEKIVTNVDLVPLKNDCKKVPRKIITEFWFCGAKAESIIGDAAYQEKLTLIEETIRDLRQRFGFNHIPQRIVILSSPSLNASFDSPRPRNNQKISCPPPAKPQSSLTTSTLLDRLPEQGTTFVILTGMIEKSSIEVLKNTIIHEWGHGKDYGLQCNWELQRSDMNDFVQLRDMAVMFAEEKFGKEALFPGSKNDTTLGKKVFYFAITESNYYEPGKGHGGHPQDNPRETYASIFAINLAFPDKFAIVASTEADSNLPSSNLFALRSLSPDIGRVLKQIAAITLEKEK